jgi:hypothetical protein
MPRRSELIPGSRAFSKHLAAGGSARDMGFKGKDGDVSKFLARLRLALEVISKPA